MQPGRGHAYWNPTRNAYLDVVNKLRERQPPTPAEIEETPRKKGWAETHCGKVLTSDKFRLSSKESYQEYWADARRSLHDSTIGELKIRETNLLSTRMDVYLALLKLSRTKPVAVDFSDGKMVFPPGTWIGAVNFELADATGLSPETVTASLDDLEEIGVIVQNRSYAGTIVQIVGYYVNRPKKDAYVSVRGDKASIDASLRVVPAEAFAPPLKGSPPTHSVKSLPEQTRREIEAIAAGRPLPGAPPPN